MKNLINRIKCKLYGHKWRFTRAAIVCDRCPATLARRTQKYGKYDTMLQVQNVAFRNELVRLVELTDNKKRRFTIARTKRLLEEHPENPLPINFREYSAIPIDALQVAEAACREAKYYKTAKELRKCLTARK